MDINPKCKCLCALAVHLKYVCIYGMQVDRAW